MSSNLRLHLLNEFRLFIDDQPVPGLHQLRLQALLAYLALHADAPQPRRRIAIQFWLDSSEKQALTNLRKLLHRLQQQFPQIDQWLEIGQHTLAWRAGAAVSSDVADLTQALNELEAAMYAPATPVRADGIPFDPALVERIMRLYTGDLLPACYDEWLLVQRDTLHDRVIRVLHHALPHLERGQAYRTGIHCADYLLRLDPTAEDIYRQLMRLHALNGNRAAALQVYQTCVRQLCDELDVPPAAETTALYQRLQQSELPPAPIGSNTAAASGAGTSGPVAQAGPDTQPSQTPLVGRQAEWRTLLTAWQAVPQRGPHFCLIWGEAGMGKTRLVEELQQWVSLRTGTVATARAYAAEGNLPYAPVTTWLRSPNIRPAIDHLARHWQTEIARLVPELQQADPTLPPPQPMTESWQQQRFHEALASVLPKVPGPCLLILDDSQWCDVETLRWLRYLLRFDPRLPLLIVGTVRSDAVIGGHPLHDLVHQLQRTQQITQLELGPLSPDAGIALIRRLAGDAVPPDAAHLAAEAEGNPLFIVEMVRARLAAEEPTPGARPAHLTDPGMANDAPRPLPATVQAVIATRLAQLSPIAHQLTELAAAAGRAFAPELLSAIGLLSEEDLIVGLDELWQRRILREEAGAYDFSHDKIREVAYAAIPPMQRRRLHRRIALALEALHAANPAPVWGQLAHHYSLAQQPQAARPYLVRLAEQAEALDAYTDAAAYFGRALALYTSDPAADPAVIFDLHARRAALLGRIGDLTTSAQDVAAMFTLARQLDDPIYLAKAYLRQAACLSRQAHAADAIQAGEQALTLYRTHADHAGEIQALRELGLICWTAQEYGRALAYGREVLQLHRRHSDIVGEATALHNLAEIYRSLHSPQQAIALYEQARGLYWGSQNQRSQAITLYGLAATYRQVAQPEMALAAYRHAEIRCEQAGDRLIRSRIYHAMGILHWEMGNTDAAIAAMGQAFALSEVTGHVPEMAYSRLAQGFMVAHTGARQTAINLLEEALAIFRRMNDPEGAREVQMRLDLLRQGRLDLPEPPAALQWQRSHIVLTDWKVYCEFELPHLAARRYQPQAQAAE